MPRVSMTAAPGVTLSGMYVPARAGDWFTPPQDSWVDVDSIDIDGSVDGVGIFLQDNITLPARRADFNRFKRLQAELLREHADAAMGDKDI